jgi:hypothetical protein
VNGYSGTALLAAILATTIFNATALSKLVILMEISIK